MNKIDKERDERIAVAIKLGWHLEKASYNLPALFIKDGWGNTKLTITTAAKVNADPRIQWQWAVTLKGIPNWRNDLPSLLSNLSGIEWNADYDPLLQFDCGNFAQGKYRVCLYEAHTKGAPISAARGTTLADAFVNAVLAWPTTSIPQGVR